MAIKKYKAVLRLDEILKEHGYSQRQLIKDSGLTAYTVNHLANHTSIDVLDKLATILNTLNQKGFNISPNELVSFEPINQTKVSVIETQYLNNSFLLFFSIQFQGDKYLDFVKITLKQKGAQHIKLSFEANNTLTLTKPMQAAVFAQPFTAGNGVSKLVQLPRTEKKAAAQILSKAIIKYALTNHVIEQQPRFIIDIDYFNIFKFHFDNLSNSNNTLSFIKDKNDFVKTTSKDSDKATYPFMHPASIGIVDKDSITTHKQPKSDTEFVENILKTHNRTHKE